MCDFLIRIGPVRDKLRVSGVVDCFLGKSFVVFQWLLGYIS